ncbi:hypothetical protein O7626_16690 [Micromonospora sp. WMMD1102]|uniref:hypothetical protein n=1 Tax=Micromonospora sp. WMMD1102 TaxID=3016105 RepID=UPI00241500F0|nr:hypothetical protein [Micromonospora sp. WMMD1102]MDG4787552.1 hypothetical protein [Micromonospora sp. WMMD1102]
MSEEPSDRVENRAHLLPEEESVGSDDPQAQAAAVLAESDAREAGAAALAESDPGTTEAERRIAEAAAAPDSFLERRTSEQTVTPEQTATLEQPAPTEQQPATPEPPD